MRVSNEQFVRHWIEGVWNQRKFEIVRERFHPQGVAHLEGSDGPVSGPEKLLAEFRVILDAFPDFHVEIDEIISSGEDVVFRWSATGTHLGPELGFASTGRKVTIKGMTWMKIREGKQVEGWDCWNQGGLVAELLKALPEPQ